MNVEYFTPPKFPQIIDMIAITHPSCAYIQEYSLPYELESLTWFADSSACHHLTPYESLLSQYKTKYMAITKCMLVIIKP